MFVWVSQFHKQVNVLIENIPVLFLLIIGMWVVHFVNYLSGYRLNRFGIIPRTLYGIFPIFFAPFIHANTAHLINNSLILSVLALMVLVNGLTIFYMVSIGVIFISGVLIWLCSRPGIHIGASALIMGYWGYLLTNSLYHPSWITVVLTLICLYYFGSVFTNLFPNKKMVSWEGHIFGCIAGIFVSYWIKPIT